MAWVGHLQKKGFTVETVAATNAQLTAIKDQFDVPRKLRSCHTGVLGGYVVEGHVPGDLIIRLLKEKPAVTGIAVPGMPIGSPGMEGPNPQPYTVYSFTKKGRIQSYSRIEP